MHACLSAVKVSKHPFTQRRSLVKLVKACLGTVKVCKRSFYQEVSDDRAGLFKYRES